MDINANKQNDANENTMAMIIALDGEGGSNFDLSTPTREWCSSPVSTPNTNPQSTGTRNAPRTRLSKNQLSPLNITSSIHQRHAKKRKLNDIDTAQKADYDDSSIASLTFNEALECETPMSINWNSPISRRPINLRRRRSNVYGSDYHNPVEENEWILASPFELDHQTDGIARIDD